MLVIPSMEDKEICCIDIQLFIDPECRMWIFWTQRDMHYAMADDRHLSTYAVICEDPDAPQLVLSEPRYIAPGFLRCQPTVLSDGRWMLAAPGGRRSDSKSPRSGGQGSLAKAAPASHAAPSRDRGLTSCVARTFR